MYAAISYVGICNIPNPAIHYIIIATVLLFGEYINEID